ncbi:hypothetical protein PoB_001566800 [Plakobranchus ocellatus]|uniref:receptor protein-tyrosine kinase n=1 Tax=Plakobranchus ocellatus TaxID=259542 RepID=A0AAV3Z325_9GAST|nr:hypothetical protein PoB_001566800 [Plakobranchus ocellatus]
MVKIKDGKLCGGLCYWFSHVTAVSYGTLVFPLYHWNFVRCTVVLSRSALELKNLRVLVCVTSVDDDDGGDNEWTVVLATDPLDKWDETPWNFSRDMTRALLLADDDLAMVSSLCLGDAAEGRLTHSTLDRESNSVWVPQDDLFQLGDRHGVNWAKGYDPYGSKGENAYDQASDMEKRLNNATLRQPGEGGGDVNTSNHMFYVAVACACAVIILIALSVTLFYITSTRNSEGYEKKTNCYETSSSQALTTQTQIFLRPDTPNNVSSSGVSSITRRGMSPSLDLKPTDVHTILNDVLVDRKRVSLGELLMEGTFGRIYTGTMLGLDENETGAEQEVYVKTVTDQANPDQVHLFLTESVLLKGLLHPNLHSLVSACMDNPAQPLVVYPAMQEGNMKKFLLKCRMAETGSRYTLNTQQLVYMTIQIIRGIQYLHRKKLLHKDIATRNCVVGAVLAVRLTDNSLARDLFPADYNCLGDNENRPVKWMALEALTQKRFSPATDVWAFGVTLWEMMTLGQQPYAEVDPFEMPSYLQEGYRIAKPHNCPDELFSLMACCWALSPDERPKFPQLLTYLQNFYLALGRYV